MDSDWERLSRLEPDMVCECGELPVLVATYHSGWGDAMGRTCPWCFGGAGSPTWVDGVWLDGEFRTGDPGELVELFVVAFRRAALRRQPDLKLRGHQDALGLWDLLARRRRWDGLVADAWTTMMRHPTMTLAEGRALMTRAWERQPPASPPDDAVDEAAWKDLKDLRSRLERVAREQAPAAPPPPTDSFTEWWRDQQSIAMAMGRPDAAAEAVVFEMDDGRLQSRAGLSLLEAAERVAEIWAAGVPDMAHQGLARADAVLRGTVPVGQRDVLTECVGLKRALGMALVALTPRTVRPFLVIWYSDQVRHALDADDLRSRLDRLPDERAVVAMIEALSAPPDR